MEDLPYRRDPRMDGTPIAPPAGQEPPTDPREQRLAYAPGEREAIESEHQHFAQFYRNDL